MKKLFFRSDGRIINYNGDFDFIIDRIRDESEKYWKIRHAEILLDVLREDLPDNLRKKHHDLIYLVKNKLRLAAVQPKVTIENKELSNENFKLFVKYSINEDHSIGPITYHILFGDFAEIDFNEEGITLFSWNGARDYECGKTETMKIYHDLIRKYKEFDKDAEKLKEYFIKTYLPKFKD